MKQFLFCLFFVYGTFSSTAQVLNGYIQIFHGASCDNQSGIMTVQATGGNGVYSYLWSNGATIDTAYNLSAGQHSVTIYSGNDSITVSQNLLPWGIDTIIVEHSCNGLLGSVYLDNINAQYPLQFTWYNSNGVMPQTTASVGNLTAGNYSYTLADADGCIDSGNVTVVESNPVLIAYVSDSTLCYGQSAQVWYTPGFTLYDNWGVSYNSNTDTIIAWNYMNSLNVPNVGVDSFGCVATMDNNPFIYIQSHPDPVPLYQIGDTISVSFILNLNPSSTLTYTWSTGMTQISSGPYSYLPIDSSGSYSVSILNQYGCTNFGSIQAYIASVKEVESKNEITIRQNPISENEYWEVNISNFIKSIPYKIYDLNGKLISSSAFNDSKTNIQAPENKGTYYLHLNNEVYKLIKL